MTFQIKPFRLADVEKFHSCLDAVARERIYLGFVEAPPLEMARQWLHDSMKRGSIRFVAVAGNQIVGWADIELNKLEGFTHAGRLGMGVLRDFRRRGIGRSLLKSVLAEARERGLERVELDVFASNKTAIRLYEAFDFRVEGRKRHARKLDGRYDDIILMGLLLDGGA